MKQHTATAGAEPGILTNIKQAMLPVFPPDIHDWRPFLLDIWEGDGDVNFGKMLAHRNPTPCSVVIRSGQGYPTSGVRVNYYKDLQYEANVLKAVATGLPWQQYHVFLPSYRDTKYQVGYARQRMETVGHFPRALWWDHQLKQNQSPETINGRLQEVMEWSAELIPEIAVQGIYVAKWVFDQYAPFEDWMNAYYFWWAKWLNTRESPGVSQVDLPRDMSHPPIMHQTTSHGDGRLFGSVPRRVDYNRAQLSMGVFMKLLGAEQKPTPDLEERVLELERFKEHVLRYGQ